MSPQFHQVFQVETVMVRSFLSDDMPESQDARNVILSYRSWQNRFGGRPDVIGTKLQINVEPPSSSVLHPPPSNIQKKSRCGFVLIALEFPSHL